MAEQKTSKTLSNTKHNCTRKCSACIYRKWYGEYALYICEISGKVIEPYYYCDIPSDIYNEWDKEICRPVYKREEK